MQHIYEYLKSYSNFQVIQHTTGYYSKICKVSVKYRSPCHSGWVPWQQVLHVIYSHLSQSYLTYSLTLVLVYQKCYWKGQKNDCLIRNREFSW